MARNDPQVNLRLPAVLKERLEETASANQRSFKAEIVARLEQSFVTDREKADWEKLIAFYTADHRYIEEEYLKGRTSDPNSGVPTGKPETDLVKQINRLISKRTEIMGEIVVRELDKSRMLVAPGEGHVPPKYVPTPEEMELLRTPPPEVMPQVLEKLAKGDTAGALLTVYRAKEAGDKA